MNICFPSSEKNTQTMSYRWCVISLYYRVFLMRDREIEKAMNNIPGNMLLPHKRIKTDTCTWTWSAYNNILIFNSCHSKWFFSTKCQFYAKEIIKFSLAAKRFVYQFYLSLFISCVDKNMDESFYEYASDVIITDEKLVNWWDQIKNHGGLAYASWIRVVFDKW